MITKGKGKVHFHNNNHRQKSRSSRNYTIATLVQVFLLLMTVSSVMASVPESVDKLLKMTSAGHVLGFDNNGVYFASGNHMLKVEFAETNGAKPVGGGLLENNTDRHPVKQVGYSAIWPGVDLVYDMVDNGIVESTWTIAKGFNPEQIRLRYNRPVFIDDSGGLKIDFETGWISESAPVAWQEIDGRRVDIPVAFKKVAAADSGWLIGFDLGSYNPAYPLLIDPLVNWHTYMGSSFNDFPRDIALDDSGNIYVLGDSAASWGNPINPHAGGMDIFVAKLSSDGTRLWNTFMGASAEAEYDDWPTDIAVDSSGNVYVVGNSDATWGTPILNYNGGGDAFVAKLNTNGALLWNTFLGAATGDGATGVAVDSTGNVFVVGSSYNNWVFVDTLLNAHSNEGSDAFVAKLSTNGVLQWYTFMGGNYVDGASAIALGPAGIYVTGGSFGGPWVSVWGYPVNSFTDGNVGVFVATLSTTGAPGWYTFFGSAAIDISEDIAVDSSGNIYVTGRSHASWGAPVNAFTTEQNAFVARLGSSGNLQWNTFMNASGGQSLAVDNLGNVYVTGISNGDTWGTPVIVTGSNGYIGKAFVVNLDVSTGVQQWSAFLGGGFADNGIGVAVDSSGDIYVTGSSIWAWGGDPVNEYVGPNFEVFFARICNTCFAVSSSAPAGEGSFFPENRGVLPNDITTFEVTAESGYLVNTVTGCGGTWTGTNPYSTGAITGDCLVTATFAVSDYTVNTSVSGGGSFSPLSRDVAVGETTTFEVTADSGYLVDTVTGCGGTWTGTNPYTTGAITEGCTVTATFAKGHTISTSVPAGGGVFNPSSKDVFEGYFTTLQLVPDSGYGLISASGCGGTLITSTSTYEINGIYEDCTVTAVFSDNSHTVSTFDPDGHAWFWPELKEVIHGETASFDVDAEWGYAITAVTGCGGTWTGGNPYITGSVTEACTVTATTVMLGNINNDDSVDLLDCILALQVVAGIVPASTVAVSGDVNGDGKVGVAEAVYALGEAAAIF